MILNFPKDEDGRWLMRKSPDGVQTIGNYGCMAPVEDCKNPGSFGVLCVLCNLCGRFEEEE